MAVAITSVICLAIVSLLAIGAVSGIARDAIARCPTMHGIHFLGMHADEDIPGWRKDGFPGPSDN